MIEERPALPAPDPPTKGWWIDPEDPTMIRRHNGKRWTNSTIRRYVPRRPEGQGVFLLGAGEEGISTGGPLAEVKGRYLGKAGIWAGIVAICVGFTGVWIGVNHDVPAAGYPGLAVILGMFGFFGITAWRAGRRLPGWQERRHSWSLFATWASIVGGAALAFWIAPLLSRTSIAYDWCNRVGIILVNGAVCTWSVVLVWAYFFGPDRNDRRTRPAQTLIVVLGLAVTTFFIWRTWDRILDALWISASS